MNQDRRKKLDEARKLISRAREILAEVREDEEEAFDNLPENLQEGDQGEAMQEAISSLDGLLRTWL